MILKIAGVVVLCLFVFSLFFTGSVWNKERDNFCKQNDFDYTENYDSSYACWKNTGTKMVIKKIHCNLDGVSIFTFQNPYRGCIFMEELT